MGGLEQWFFGHIGWIVLGAGILTAVSGYGLTVRQGRFAQEMQTRAEENLRQTQEVLNRAEETIRQITGGDSYCYFSPARQPPEGSGHPFVLSVTGKYPLYDLTANIVDLDIVQQSDPPISLQEVLSRQRIMPIGNLSSTYGRMERWDIGQGDSHRYAIHFFARNGYFSQYLTVRIVNGVLVSASRVERDRKVIEGSLRIAHDFPRDDQGQIQW